jgi:hypothetical protein
LSKGFLAGCVTGTEQQLIRNPILANIDSEALIQNIQNAHDYHIAWLCLIPNQQMLVSADMYSIYSTAPGDSLQTIRVWDTISSDQIALLSELTQNATFGVFAFNPNGQHFSVGGKLYAIARAEVLDIYDVEVLNTPRSCFC